MLNEENTTIDVVVLTRDHSPIDARVLQGINQQDGVSVVLHRVVGNSRTTDQNRWETIARARNIGRALGESSWLMFVDDDVVLGKDCISQLLRELEANQDLAAVGADYLSQRNPHGISPHVAMGATLFRREAFSSTGFRATRDTCECQCVANDLRSQAFEIDYSPIAIAEHLDLAETPIDPNRAETKELVRPQDDVAKPVSEPHRDPAVMVAFDRNHMGVFTGRFLARLRASGNQSMVYAVTFGLKPKDIRALNRLTNVRCYPQPFTSNLIGRARLVGFQSVLRSICPKTPVAYWDAGDVLFQGSLDPLWSLIHQNPNTMLVTEEPLDWARNTVHREWVYRILNPQVRKKTAMMLRDNPVINGGFIAGRADLLLEHFKHANRLNVGPLIGVGGGDQVALNYCRYEKPAHFQVVDDAWNYCLFGRNANDFSIRRGNYYRLPSNAKVPVIHGNGASLKLS